MARIKPDKCPVCNSTDIYQDDDVLDTWFSSWLWPFATFGWPFVKGQSPRGTAPCKELAYFYPTSVLVTAPEIIFFWVARMIMAGLKFMQDIPFSDVYIHGTVRDIEGKKMSKSLGNIIDPLEIISEYGADALRFSLVSITAQGQDVFLSEERFEQGRNFANKIWNASRFILMNLEPTQTRADLCVFFRQENLDIVNRWILSRFYSVLKTLNKYLDTYKFNEAANLLYGFFWHEFCDWYLELIKPQIKDPRNQLVMYKVLEKFLRVLHPFMPFLTEEIWQKLKPGSESIVTGPWPHVQEQIIDKRAEKEAQTVFSLITQIRNLRSSLEIRPEQKVKISLHAHNKAKEKLLEDNRDLMINLAKLEQLILAGSSIRPSSTVSAITEEIDIYLHTSGLPDIAVEQDKIKTKIDNLKRAIKAKEATLDNPNFIKRAPPEIVEKEKDDKLKLSHELKRLEKMLHELQ